MKRLERWSRFGKPAIVLHTRLVTTHVIEIRRQRDPDSPGGTETVATLFCLPGKTSSNWRWYIRGKANEQLGAGGGYKTLESAADKAFALLKKSYGL